MTQTKRSAVSTWLAAAALAGSLALAAAGCGDDEPTAASTTAVRTAAPERTFAPLIQTGFGSDYRPMSADWFLERSVVRTADSGPYAGRRYRDLGDEHRGGPPDPAPGTEVPRSLPVYFERRDEGDRTRIGYWMLYGMNLPEGRPAATREGDWERVDVILDRVGDDLYEPRSAQLDFDPGDPSAEGGRTVRWRGLIRAGRTHPIFISHGQDHVLTPAADNCGGCIHWHTWTALRDAGAEPWAGFDGPWGEVGPTVATSGPLGPTAGG